MVADEPQSLVSLATALGAPVPAVRQSIERLVADYDGADGRLRRGFELREVAGGWRIYVRGDYDDVVRDFVLRPEPQQAVPGGAGDPRRDRLQAADQPRRDRVDPRRQRRLGGAHPARPRA